MLRAPGQEEPRVAGVHQGVTERGEVDGSDVRVGRRFWLSAGVSWNGIYSVRKCSDLVYYALNLRV